MLSKSQALIVVHMIVGYPTVFLVGPLALSAFASPKPHRRWGLRFLVLMSFLYLSGSALTFARGDWDSWAFARNVLFNFFGFSMLLYGWRSIHLYRQAGQPKPSGLDWVLAGLLTTTVLAMAAVAWVRDTPMRVLTAAGLVLVALDYRDLSAGFAPRYRLYARHVRFVLASYFYVLTVVSIVHLKDELGRDVRWLWPGVLGTAAIAVASVAASRPGASWRLPVLRGVVRAVLVVTGLYGGYVAFDLITRGPVAGQETGPTAAEPRQLLGDHGGPGSRP